MISCDGGRCKLQGPVTIGNVAAVLEEGARLFTAPEVTVDLSGMTEVDSSAVSLLLEWRRAALRGDRRIRFVNLPENLGSLAELYGVTELLGAA
ncbi:MAG: STAS domain-containing protein [Betaproteobacteria bacterium]|nr:STAS domain-containing protein [Betaproteobacteria bacterium]